jgi:hypothetical protein
MIEQKIKKVNVAKKVNTLIKKLNIHTIKTNSSEI